MTDESAGSKAREHTAMFGRKSVTEIHDAPPSIVFQTPPETAAAYMMSESCGSMSSARVRPPTLPGPRNCQPRAASDVGRVLNPSFSPSARTG